MKRIRQIIGLIHFNWKPLVGFEILYKAGSTLISVPLLFGALNLVMKASGYAYLTLENIVSFLLNPFTLAALLVILIVAAIHAMIDISAVIFALDQSMQKNRVTTGQIFRFALRNAIRVCRPKNILLVPVVLLLLPFVHIGLASSFLTTISIPEFIMDTIRANRILALLFGAVTILLTLLAVRWIYAFHYFTLEGCNFRDARTRSVALGKGRKIWDFLAMLLLQAVLSLLYILFLLLAITLAHLIGKVFSHFFILRWLASTTVWFAIVVSLAVIAFLAVPVGYGAVSVFFYRHKERSGEAILHATVPEARERKSPGRAVRILKGVFTCLVVAGSLALGFLLCTGRINPEVEHLRMMEVTAHRGASAFFPENTMAAFEGARDLGADWIELDVQQSKDGKIFVIHDTNFRRTTGVSADTWELTYDEISRLDAGSFFSPEFAGEKIPLLSEVLEFARLNGMKLNIELKPTGHETDFEQCVIDDIRAARMENACVITSQVYHVLENVKAYDPTITTVYVMSLAYGDINQLTAADDFSVEASNATPSMVSRVHNAGKQIYAWTINTEENINRMIEVNVDNIITDNIELANQCIYESRYSTFLEEFMKLFR